MEFSEEHLEVFKSTLDDTLPAWVGTAPQSWAEYVFREPNQRQIMQPDLLETLSARAISRQELFQMTSNKSIGDQAFAVSILAWGGMNRRHGEALFRTSKAWIPVVTSLRNQSIDSMTAYQKFQELRADGCLPGMRPAYFTKLIFFAAPTHDAFIMDQWTARSANLLTGEKLVHMTSVRSRTGRVSYTVSDRNANETYVEFCDFIYKLADEVGYQGKEARIEEALFSTGRGEGRWRNHVISFG